jgi:outer membrane protein TolC
LQPRISGKLSIADAVKLALAHNKMLQLTLEEREVARGVNVSARSAYLPSVALNGQYRREEEVPSFDIPGPGGTTQHVELGNVDNYSVA